MKPAQPGYNSQTVFHQLALASTNTLDGFEYESNYEIVCFVPRGTRICLPINMGNFLNDGIYVESAYESHVRTFISRPVGSRRVAREFGFFQLTLLMSKPIYNDVRKKIYRILAFLSFKQGMFASYFSDPHSNPLRPLKIMYKMYDLL
jgi:hypothetical protein